MRTIERRTFLLGLGAALVGCGAPTAPTAPTPLPVEVDNGLAALEQRFGGRLGVHAVDTGSGAVVSHRGDERFLLASTSKAFIAAAVLQRAADDPTLLDRVITYEPSVLIANSPITEQSLAMTVADLCAAAITYSDNAAANLLFDVLGGPPAVTTFVRGIGDGVTRFDRPETELNISAGPDDERDTTTPSAVVRSLQAVTLGDGLAPAGRDRLTGWLLANTTGEKTIRAGAPAGWRVGDKTGTGFQGERNDIGVLYPPDRAPIVLAVYTAPADPNADPSDATIAEATRAVVAALG
ncbi:class A beta-lactamase [Pseudonocardia abyssalis]|uniref:Beta-lactamase n=1 Tax=Pseudonocardia abyssalis TaxID=2792008 RepID=A0ABS6UWI7_9PSEU|nr:class A beta-lactamase [Pseudonocardia abyssalis]MBW0114083.1 class A beta-lactamase [Pseudonocardia abyssalis]MBW0136642.1 class A beta-lactamase [Pseudonocardia abyssalis]